MEEYEQMYPYPLTKATVYSFYELEIMEIYKTLQSIGLTDDDILNNLQKNLGIPEDYIQTVKDFIDNCMIPTADYIRYFLASDVPKYKAAKLARTSTHTVNKIQSQEYEPETHLQDLFKQSPDLNYALGRLVGNLNLFEGNYFEARYILESFQYSEEDRRSLDYLKRFLASDSGKVNFMENAPSGHYSGELYRGVNYAAFLEQDKYLKFVEFKEDGEIWVHEYIKTPELSLNMKVYSKPTLLRVF